MTHETVTRTWHPDGSCSVAGWRENGAVECPRCGEIQPLIEDVEAWETQTGKIVGWGPGTAECCGLLMICSWDRDYVFELDDEAYDEEEVAP